MAPSRWSIALVAVVGCARTAESVSAPSVVVAIASVSDAGSAMARPPSPLAKKAEDEGDEPEPTRPSIYVDEAPPGLALRRYDHAVIFFVRTQTRWDKDGGNEHDETRLIPIACSDRRAVVTGRVFMRSSHSC